MTWWTYVVQTSGTDSPKQMSMTTGIDGPNFSKWKAGQTPGPAIAAQFARAHGRPVLEAFVAAGFLTPEEAKVRPAAAPDLTRLTNDEVLELVRARMREEGEVGGNTAATKRQREPRRPRLSEDEIDAIARSVSNLPTSPRPDPEPRRRQRDG